MTANNSYDELPYPLRSHPAAHVRRLEAVATLFGMRPPAIERCRVLELGSACGWNLIPQAGEFPGSSFVGVELSQRQVADARALVTTLALENVDIRQADLLAVDRSWGEFDYILAHGVFSWVPRAVQDQILAICKTNLARDGVALVSYNVLPGWHFRGAIRDLMLYHVAQVTDPRRRIAQARAALDFLAENCRAESAYGKILREELDVVRKADDQYLFHDYLEGHNEAFYFHEFIQRTEAAGLRYLGDANIATMLPRSHSENAERTLGRAPLVKQEQYLDFLWNRAFRSSLLCHEGTTLDRNLRPSIATKFHVTLSARAEELRGGVGDEPLTLRLKGQTIQAATPLEKSLLTQLSKNWPASTSFGELERVLAVPSEQLAGVLIGLLLGGVVDFSVCPWQVVQEISLRPRATRLARAQLPLSDMVTNQRHENVALDEVSRFVLAQLDGSRDRAALRNQLRDAIARGVVNSPWQDRPLASDDAMLLDDAIERVLRILRDAALLVG
jgi:methyltransferase-like protein